MQGDFVTRAGDKALRHVIQMQRASALPDDLTVLIRGVEDELLLELREARRLWPEKPTSDPPRRRAYRRAAWRKRVDSLLARAEARNG